MALSITHPPPTPPPPPPHPLTTTVLGLLLNRLVVLLLRGGSAGAEIYYYITAQHSIISNPTAGVINTHEHPPPPPCVWVGGVCWHLNRNEIIHFLLQCALGDKRAEATYSTTESPSACNPVCKWHCVGLSVYLQLLSTFPEFLSDWNLQYLFSSSGSPSTPDAPSPSGVRANPSATPFAFDLICSQWAVYSPPSPLKGIDVPSSALNQLQEE